MSWPIVPLGEVCKIQIGRTPSRANKSYWERGSLPWVSIGDMSRSTRISNTKEMITERAASETGCKKVAAGTVLMSFKLSIGKVAIAQIPLFTNEAIAALEISEPKFLNSYFLFRAIESINFEDVGNRAVLGRTLNKQSLSEIKIPLPPFDKQCQIVTVLDKADGLRRKRREALLFTDQLAHALYRESFGDPVVNPSKLPTATLGKLDVDLVYGPRFYNEEYSDGGVRIVRITDLSDMGELDFEAMPRLRVSQADLLAHKARPGELLFARTGATVGKVAIISADDPICIPGAYFIRLRFPDYIDPIFAWYTLRCPPIQEIIAERSRQSAQQNFSGPGLRRLPFTIPALAHQHAFVNRVKEIKKLKAHHRAQLASLDSLFTSLQSRAFSSQL